MSSCCVQKTIHFSIDVSRDIYPLAEALFRQLRWLKQTPAGQKTGVVDNLPHLLYILASLSDIDGALWMIVGRDGPWKTCEEIPNVDLICRDCYTDQGK